MASKHDFEYPVCPQCGVNKRLFNYLSKKDGRPLFKKLCADCSGKKVKDRQRYRDGKMPSKMERDCGEAYQRKIKNLTCECCGFKAKHQIQLDIDHIDGNHNNNDSTNLWVLCANCHRLKTHKYRDMKKE